jgi:8-oxo-dGTP diphosphatase
MLEVVAALIWENDRFLICRRPAHKTQAMLWEFVGGKVEPGETPEEALVRECREELDVTVEPLSVFTQVTHDYPDVRVHLTLFTARIVSGEPKLLEHSAIEWITPSEIPDFDFCPADAEILKIIMKESE